MDGKGGRNGGKGSADRWGDKNVTVAQWPGRKEVKVWSM